MESLRKLCGALPDPQNKSRIAAIQNILGRDVERYGRQVAAMLAPGADPEQISLYGCFATRKMLEGGCVAILSRVDPARLLILREFQVRGKYPLDERHSASIDWTSDVISEKKPGWSDAVPPDKFIRSLLGGHLAEAIWVSAIEMLPECAPLEATVSSWLDELLSQYDSAVAKAQDKPPKVVEGEPVHEDNRAELAILSSFRTAAKQLFSTLSKGVHLEFVVDQAAVFDTPTVLVTMRQAVKALAQIAFVSHFIDSANSAISHAEAVALVEEIEGQIEHH